MRLRHLIGPQDITLEETNRILELARRISANMDSYSIKVRL